MIMDDRIEEAIQHIKEMRNIFRDNFYIEVQNHDLDWQMPLKQALFSIADGSSIPIVATQDSHYQHRKDAALHEKICKLNAGNLSFDSDHSWFKSEDEMKEMFAPEEWEAIYNTQLVADTCNCEWNHSKTIWPLYNIEKGKTAEQQLREMSWEGFESKFGAGNKEYKERLEYELDMIVQMGFPTYFLIVQDFISWAKENKIATGPGRGSCAGSLVTYCLGITNVDPIKYGLYFERFINPSRAGIPDYSQDLPEKLNIPKDLTVEKLLDIL
jgi:DNA polymerase-3 subunit alpha